MNMVKHLVLFQHYGENADTSKSPAAVVVSKSGDSVCVDWGKGAAFDYVDMSKQKTCCMNWDNNMLVQVDLYAVREVELPDWLPVERWVFRSGVQVSLKWFLGFGGCVEWGREWFERLSGLGEAGRFACIELLKVKRFRSSFRASLREQLEAWLNDPAPRYESPFSARQWDSILNCHVARRAKQTSNALYHAGR